MHFVNEDIKKTIDWDLEGLRSIQIQEKNVKDTSEKHPDEKNMKFEEMELGKTKTKNS